MDVRVAGAGGGDGGGGRKRGLGTGQKQKQKQKQGQGQGQGKLSQDARKQRRAAERAAKRTERRREKERERRVKDAKTARKVQEDENKDEDEDEDATAEEEEEEVEVEQEAVGRQPKARVRVAERQAPGQEDDNAEDGEEEEDMMRLMESSADEDEEDGAGGKRSRKRQRRTGQGTNDTHKPGGWAPWLRRYSAHERMAHPLVLLHNEILDLCDLLALTEEEKRKRADVLEEMRDVVDEALNRDAPPGRKYTVYVFGSEFTRLILPTSDMDLVVLEENVEENGAVSANDDTFDSDIAVDDDGEEEQEQEQEQEEDNGRQGKKKRKKKKQKQKQQQKQQQQQQKKNTASASARDRADGPILAVDYRSEQALKSAAVPILRKVAKVLSSRGIVDYLEVVATARVPIIKFHHTDSNLSLDISFNVCNGGDTSKQLREFMVQYPAMVPLTLVLKLYLSQRHLHETFLGGIGSYVTSLMVVSYLQHRERHDQVMENRLHHDTRGRRDPPSMRAVRSPPNLGSMLLDLLALYGSEFNYVHTGISVRDGGYYFDKRGRDWVQMGPRAFGLSVENPVAPENDIGRNSYDIKKVRRSFEHSHQVLEAAMNLAQQARERAQRTGGTACPRSFLSYLIRVDDPVLLSRALPDMRSFTVRSALVQGDTNSRQWFPRSSAAAQDAAIATAAAEAMTAQDGAQGAAAVALKPGEVIVVSDDDTGDHDVAAAAAAADHDDDDDEVELVSNAGGEPHIPRFR